MAAFPNLNSLAQQIFEDNQKKGFWTFDRSNAQLLVLIQSEMFEALEAERKSTYAKERINCQQKIGTAEFQQFFKENIKDSLEDELADTVIRILDMCGGRKVDLSSIYLIPNLRSWTQENDSLSLMPTEKYSLAAIVLEFSYLISRLLQQTANTTCPEQVLAKGASQLLLFVLSVAQHYQVRIWEHVELKLAYNRSRAHKHGKKY